MEKCLDFLNFEDSVILEPEDATGYWKWMVEHYPDGIQPDVDTDEIPPAPIDEADDGCTEADAGSYYKWFRQQDPDALVDLDQFSDPIIHNVPDDTENETPESTASTPSNLIWDDIHAFHPMLDFVGDRAFVSVNFFVDGSDTAMPHLVSSDGSIMPLTRESLARLDLRWTREITSAPANQWLKCHLKKFVGGERHVDAGRLFDDILDAFRDYVYFQEPDMYEFIALWTIGTYLHPIFPAYPMVLVNGPKGSGKSRTTLTTARMAFNSCTEGDPTSAIMFRQIDEKRPTMIFDEMEWLSSKNGNSSITDLLKFGYKQGFSVSRCMFDGKNPYVVHYDVYSPKMFTNIKGLEDVLGDRTITIQQIRKPSSVSVSDIDPDEKDPRWAELRHRLYLFTFKYWQDIRTLMNSQTCNPLKNREYELFVGIFAIAEFMESVAGKAGLVEKIRSLALRKSAERREADREANHDLLIIQALQSLVDENDWYTVLDVITEIRKYRATSTDWINEEWTGRGLTRLGIGKRPGTKRRGWVNVYLSERKNLTQYYITAAEVERLAAQYGLEGDHLRDSDPDSMDRF
jgi:hypothetical protein